MDKKITYFADNGVAICENWQVNKSYEGTAKIMENGRFVFRQRQPMPENDPKRMIYDDGKQTADGNWTLKHTKNVVQVKITLNRQTLAAMKKAYNDFQMQALMSLDENHESL